MGIETKRRRISGCVGKGHDELILEWISACRDGKRMSAGAGARQLMNGVSGAHMVYACMGFVESNAVK